MRRVAAGLSPYWLPIVVLIGAWVYFTSTVANFRGEGAVFATLEQFALLGLIALGVGVTMIAGELDLSTASMAALAGVVAIAVSPAGLVVSLIVAVAMGGLVGAAQGLVIASTRINSIVLTVATLILLRGIANLPSSDKAVLASNIAVGDPLFDRWWVFSLSTAIALVVFAVVGVFLSRIKFGREIYAIGGGRAEAFAAGVPRWRSLIIAFAISGACAALAGSMASLRAASADPNNFDTLLLGGVTAALVGGMGLYGGRGTVWNLVLGVAIVGTVSAGLTAIPAQSYVTQLVIGCLLVVVVALEYGGGRLERLRARRAKRPPAGEAITPT